MKVSTFEGYVENGQVRLPVSVRLPEKAKVYVVVPDLEVRSIPYIGSPRLVHQEEAVNLQKKVVEGKLNGGL